MGLGGKHDIGKTAILKMLDETLTRHHELFGLRKVIALGDILLKRARVHANANRAPSGARGIDHSIDLGPIANVAGIDAELSGTGLHGANGELMVKVDIGNDRHRRLRTNRAKALKRGLGRHTHTHNITTRLGKRTHLRKRCLASAVSVQVMDWTTTGAPPPICTPPTCTGRVKSRGKGWDKDNPNTPLQNK